METTLKFFKHVVIIFTNGLSQRGLLFHKTAILATVTNLKTGTLLIARLSLQPQLLFFVGGRELIDELLEKALHK